MDSLQYCMKIKCLAGTIVKEVEGDVKVSTRKSKSDKGRDVSEDQKGSSCNERCIFSRVTLK